MSMCAACYKSSNKGSYTEASTLGVGCHFDLLDNQRVLLKWLGSVPPASLFLSFSVSLALSFSLWAPPAADANQSRARGCSRLATALAARVRSHLLPTASQHPSSLQAILLFCVSCVLFEFRFGPAGSTPRCPSTPAPHPLPTPLGLLLPLF